MGSDAFEDKLAEGLQAILGFEGIKGTKGLVFVGLGFRVWGLGFGGWGLGFRGLGFGLRGIQGLAFCGFGT